MKINKTKLKRIGSNLGLSWDKVPFSEFALGVKEEQEHQDVTGGDLETTAKIATAHLRIDNLYYTHQKNQHCGMNWAYVPSEVYVRRAPELDGGGLQAYVVNGKFVRSHIFQDYTQGGNPAVYRFVPTGQMWIDESLDAEDRKYTARHEAYEYRRMKEGAAYETAHAEANVYESKLRDGGVDTTKEDKLARLFYRPKGNGHRPVRIVRTAGNELAFSHKRNTIGLSISPTTTRSRRRGKHSRFPKIITGEGKVIERRGNALMR